MTSRELARAGLMTALVFVITRSFVLPIPQTKGFFNLGEAGIYMAAVLFGPKVGALAGGVGSALADLSLGYGQYAPFTLIIKGLEGAIVGSLLQGVPGRSWRLIAAIGGVLVAVWAITSGPANWPVWLAAVVLVAAALVGSVGQRTGAGRVSSQVAAMLAGGLVMVAGYFVAQAYFLGLGVAAALVEAPYNLVQVAVGLVTGLAAAAAFERALPGLAR